MGIFIEDGRGTGKIAGVDENNRLDTAAIMTPLRSAKSLEGEFGICGTPPLTVTTTGGSILYIKNNDSRPMKIASMYFFNDGGSTNYNRPIWVTIYYGYGEPTANMTQGAPANLNKASAKSADVDTYYWDEVGNGMTMGGAPSGALYGVSAPYVYELQFEGSNILGQNDTIVIGARGIETSEVTVYITFYY